VITPSEPNVTIDTNKITAVDKEGNPVEDVTIEATVGDDGKIHITVTPGENAPDGPIDVVLGEGAITDGAGNPNEETKVENVTTVDNTKPTVGEVVKPEEGTGTQTGNTAEVVITPSEPNVTIDTNKITAVDKEGNPVEDVTIEANIGDDGNIHITVTPGENAPDGPIDVVLGEGAITDGAGNPNEETKVENVTTVDNTKPTMEIVNPTEGAPLKQGETLIFTITPSETVTIDTDKIKLTGEGATEAQKEAIQNADKSITITITAGTGTGEMEIQLAEGFLTDTAGNQSIAQLLPTYQIDNAGPNVTVSVSSTTTSSITVGTTAKDIGIAGMEENTTYTYYISQDSNFPTGSTKTYTSQETNYTFSDLTHGVTYYIKAQAQDKKGNVGTSATIQIKTGTVPVGNGNITISTITWNQDATTTTPGTANVMLQNTKKDYTLEYQTQPNGGAMLEEAWTAVAEETTTLTGLHHADKIYARLKDTKGNTGSYTTFDIQDATPPTPATLVMKQTNESGEAYTNNTWTNQNIYLNSNGGYDQQSGLKSVQAIQKDANLTLPTTITEEGTTTITITTTDWATLTATNTYTINIDRTPPSITSVTETTQGTLEAIATDSLSGIVAYQFSTTPDLTAQSTGWQTIDVVKTTTQTYNITKNGTYYFYVKDAVGYTAKQSITITSFDTARPTIDSIEKSTENWTNQDVTITIKATDPDTGIVAYQFSTNENITIESSGWNTIETTNTQISQDYTVEQNGTYYFYAKDAVGNLTKQAIEITNIDKDKPMVNTITQSPENWTKETVTLTATAKDSLSGIQAYQFSKTAGLTAESAGWEEIPATTQTISKTFTADTNTNYYFYAKDQAGNVESNSIEITNIDTTAPTIESFAATTNTTNSITVGVQANDTGAGLATTGTYTYYISETTTFPEEGTSSTTNTHTFTGLKENTNYYFKVLVKDAVGNTKEAGADGSIFRETGTIPSADTYITASPVTWNNNGTTSQEGTAKVTINKQESVGTYTMVYKIMQGSTTIQNWTNAAGNTETINNLKHGYTVIAGLDDGTNTGVNTKTISILDATDPTPATLVMKQTNESGKAYTNNTWTNQNIYIQSTGGSDQQSGLKTVQATKNDANLTLPTTVTDEGTTTITLTTTDWAGRTAANTYNLKIDKTDPTPGTITMKQGGSTETAYTNNTWTNQNVYIHLNNGTDEVGGSGHKTTTYTITGGTYNGSTHYTENTTLTETGIYTIQVTTTDNAGNTTGNSYTVKIDKGGSTSSITSLTQAPTTPTNGTVTLTGKAKNSTSGIVAYQFSTDSTLTGTSTGWIDITSTTGETTQNHEITDNNTYYFYIKDGAGNVTKKAITVNNIDKTPPTITIGEPSTTYLKNGQTATYNITTSKTVTLSDSIQATVTGDASTGSTVTITGNGTTYVAILTAGNGNGAITLNLPAGLFQDSAGNTSAQVTKPGVILDNTAPTITSFSATDIASDSITVTVRATDNTGGIGLDTENTYNYYISETTTFIASPVTKTETTHTFTGLTAGKKYYLAVTVKDKLGNTTKTSDSNANISANAGTVPEGTGNIRISDVTWNANGTPTQEGTANITVTNTQTNYTMQYQKQENGGAKTEEGWNDVSASLVKIDGLHHDDIVYARLVDKAGNTGNTTSTHILDTTNPTPATAILKQGTENGTTYTQNTWTNQNIYVNETGASDQQSGVKSVQATQNGTNLTLPTTLTEEGTTTLTLTTTDWAGKTAANTYTLKIDKTKPNITALTQSTTNPTNRDITLTGTAQDTASGIVAYQYSTANNLTAQSTGWNTITTTTEMYVAPEYTVSANGTYYFYVKDVVGNVSKEEINIDNIDKTPPTILSISNPVGGGASYTKEDGTLYIGKGGKATFTVTMSEKVTLLDKNKIYLINTEYVIKLTDDVTIEVTGEGTNWNITVTVGTRNYYKVSLVIEPGAFQDLVGNVMEKSEEGTLEGDPRYPKICYPEEQTDLPPWCEINLSQSNVVMEELGYKQAGFAIMDLANFEDDWIWATTKTEGAKEYSLGYLKVDTTGMKSVTEIEILGDYGSTVETSHVIGLSETENIDLKGGNYEKLYEHNDGTILQYGEVDLTVTLEANKIYYIHFLTFTSSAQVQSYDNCNYMWLVFYIPLNKLKTSGNKAGVIVDTEGPTMTVSPSLGSVDKNSKVTVTIEDRCLLPGEASGLSSSINKTYYLSTSPTNPTASGYQSGTYTSGTAFTIGTGLTGTYYLFIPVVTDNVGNTSTATIANYYRCGPYVFDNTV